MPNRTPILAASLLALCTAASAQTDLQALGAFPCDSSGSPKAVQLGEPFWVRMNFRVSGTPNSTFKFRVETDYAKLDSGRLGFGTTPGDYWVFWGPIPTLMDGPLTVKATLDPERKVREGNRANNTLSFTLSPAPSALPIELFGAKGLSGKMGVELQFRGSSALPQSLTCWMPVPPTQGFQAASSFIPDAYQTTSSSPFQQFLAARTWRPSDLSLVHEEASLNSTAHSVRVSLDQLRLMSRTADPEMSPWLQRETLVELERPEFAAWLASAVPAETRASLSTVDLAQKIYQSILKKATYQYRTGVEPSAYRTLRSKKGDCGALSSLFVALCRTAGIPARTVNGFSVGQNKWHVWAEFHVNGAGWIPVDPAYAEGRLPKGSDLPIYFGVIPELNERFATSLGLDRESGGLSLKMLQSPAMFWQGSGVRVQKVSNFCELSSN